jgi:putative ABC transport system ATP-binding protein
MNSTPLIQLDNIQKSYQLGEIKIHALRGLTLTLNKGDFTALIGASGSGKSTLLNLIGCLDTPDSGHVWMEGQDVHKLSEDEKSYLRNEKIGFIFQSFNLIPVLNVFENIELPLFVRKDMSPEERTKRVLTALADVGLQDFATHAPDKLSGGQRQRVAIARALVTGPHLILADEPTANLDSKTAHMIIDLLLDLNKKKHVTFFFCSHDEKLIDRVQRVVRIKDGIIVDRE